VSAAKPAVVLLAEYLDGLPKPVSVILHLPADGNPRVNVIIEHPQPGTNKRMGATFVLDLNGLDDSKWAMGAERDAFARAVRQLAAAKPPPKPDGFSEFVKKACGG